jgi:hypothetical protein
MPEVLLDDGQRHASLNHAGRTRVAQIMDTRRLRESFPHGAIAAGLPSAVEELLCVNGIARAVGKKKTGAVRSMMSSAAGGRLIVRIDFLAFGGPISGR